MIENNILIAEVAYHLHKLNAALTEAANHGIDLTVRVLAGRDEDFNHLGDYNDFCAAQVRVTETREIV